MKRLQSVLRGQSQHSSALKFASKTIVIHSLWLVAWFYLTDAATIETVAPVTSHSWIGQTIKLTCKADGSPTPTLFWKNPSGRVIRQETKLNTTADVLMRSDQESGNYTCEATNDVNIDKSTVQVQQISKLNYRFLGCISSRISENVSSNGPFCVQ